MLMTIVTPSRGDADVGCICCTKTNQKIIWVNMSTNSESAEKRLPTGVMLNAYPDSIGKVLADTVKMLKSPELKEAFS